MSIRHQYIGIENLGLNASQKQSLVAALRQLGNANNDPQPALRNHWAIRADNEAVIFEALFDDDQWTIAKTKERLGALFGVAVGSINHTTSTLAVGGTTSTVVRFTYNSQARLHLVIFGTLTADYETSRAAAVAYKIANAAQWGGDV